jgi:redox-sensitive bicupin YhaK (pirin superfamily)
MPTYRDIRVVVRALPAEVDGIPVRQPLPRGGLSYVDPFLLLHHMGPLQFPGGHRPQEHGVGPHPHRGFEPVTFVYRGGVHHRDSRGNNSVVQAGGVQWLTAGMGIVHSERPSRALVEQGGELEIVQVWVNLPARDKWVQPRYQGFADRDIPRVTSSDGLVSIQVAAGTLQGMTGPVSTHTPLLALNARFSGGGRHYFPLPDGYNAFAYLLDGRCIVNEHRAVDGGHLIHFAGDVGGVQIQAEAETRLLLMAGEPLHEKVVRSGPYVMNDHTQILEALRDARMGKMGVLTESF